MVSVEVMVKEGVIVFDDVCVCEGVLEAVLDLVGVSVEDIVLEGVVEAV